MNSRQDQIERFRKLIASGQIKLGMTRDQVTSLLGEPDDVSTTTQRRHYPSIYKYGDVEVHFEGQRFQDVLRLVFLDCTESEPHVTLLSTLGEYGEMS